MDERIIIKNWPPEFGWKCDFVETFRYVSLLERANWFEKKTKRVTCKSF